MCGATSEPFCSVLSPEHVLERAMQDVGQRVVAGRLGVLGAVDLTFDVRAAA